MTKVKICGLRRLEDVEMLNEFKPDFAGFVFAPSKRQVTFEEAQNLRRHLDKEIQTVGVFVDAEREFIAALVEEGVIDCIQLHGNEDGFYINSLKETLTVPIIKAVRVSSREDAARETGADMVLFDAYHRQLQGGTGETFNWDLLEGTDGRYFLAGGLHAGNIRKAIRRLHPYAVDVSSGVETDGWKDKEKVRKFMQNIQEVAR